MRFLNIRQLSLLLVLILIACQDEKLENEVNVQDEDLLAANAIADEYFQNFKGKSDKKEERSITILKFKDGQILYNTNTDDIDGYRVVTETTITAYVEPGEYVFWYRGGGLDDVDGIDFDDDAEAYLSELPEEYKPDQMWVLHIPEDFNGHLKYDIVYKSKEDPNVTVRLDPKITVGGQSASQTTEI